MVPTRGHLPGAGWMLGISLVPCRCNRQMLRVAAVRSSHASIVMAGSLLSHISQVYCGFVCEFRTFKVKVVCISICLMVLGYNIWNVLCKVCLCLVFYMCLQNLDRLLGFSDIKITSFLHKITRLRVDSGS